MIQQIYDLTHPDELTFAELARKAELADKLETYEVAVMSLSELLRGNNAQTEH